MLGNDDIEKLLTVPETMNAVEQAFRLIAHGKASHPDERIFHKYGRDLASIFAISACDTTSNTMILKALSVNWSNPERLSLPHMYGIILLCDLVSGRPRCIMDAVHLTNVRTGAIAGVAARYLARKNSTTLAVIGSREIARFATLSIMNAIPNISRIRVYSKSKSNREQFAKKMELLVADVAASNSPIETVSNADIVISATSSDEPLITSPMLQNGVFVASLGSPEEVDPFVLKTMNVVPESVTECTKRGKCGNAIKKGIFSEDNIYADLPSIVVHKFPGRISDDQNFFFDSIGLAEEDLCVANLILSKASEEKAGKDVSF